MIDEEGRRLYNEIIALLAAEEDNLSEDIKKAMDKYDEYMNILNCTKNVMYGKHGEVLMKC